MNPPAPQDRCGDKWVGDSMAQPDV